MQQTDTRRKLIGFAVWMLVVFSAAALGALASIEAGEFYLQLNRPAWAPPAGVFGPVWTLLYAMMGLAAWLVWREGGWSAQRPALLLFLIQLGFNALWSWLFFAWHRGGLAFAEILLLLALIVATLMLFWRARRSAALLMLPYLLWVSFASILNYAVWQLNPQALG